MTVAYIATPLPPDAKMADIVLLRSLDNALKTQRIASLARAAIARSPAMSRLSNDRREVRFRAEERARTDANVVTRAQQASLYVGNEQNPVAKDGSRRFIVGEWKRLVKLPGDDH
jgi:hypothetical protein